MIADTDPTPPHGIERPQIEQLGLFCSCDVPSPILTEGVDGEECASCRKPVAR